MGFDLVLIWVHGGNGGHGILSFRREKFVPRGGPDGGDGGNGGNVTLVGTRGIDTLLNVTEGKQYRAIDGTKGGKNRRHGKNGKSLKLKIPLGTVAWDEARGDAVGEVVEDGEQMVIAQGGRGGWGNVHFKTSVRQAPRVAQAGESGEERTIRLELKTIGDVGLMGLPNAGKSSLLAALTAAHPKVAAYPFTTLSPNLGVMDDGRRSYVLADIPGIIEGASQGIGLGLDFLRHIERARILAHVIDGEAENPVVNYRTIRNELASYGEGVTEKPEIIVLNKVDLLSDQNRDEILARLQEAAPDVTTIAASALEGTGISSVEAILEESVTALPGRETRPEFRVFRPQPAQLEVVRDEERRRWVVLGDSAARFAESLNLAEPDARAVLWEDLDSKGLTKQLRRAGAQPGQPIAIGEVTMEFPG